VAGPESESRTAAGTGSWGIPTVTLEMTVYRILKNLKKAGKQLLPVAMAGGFTTEDQIYKGLALGAPYIGMIAIGRASRIGGPANRGSRVSVGLKQIMALNRKFALQYIDREDIVPLTDIAAEETGLATYKERTQSILSM
jgi:hypothetical protein